ncbi:MAG: hypothetical protein VB958_12150 [Thalassolituus sp.]|uniref:hypothetical protein n=1 Tax=Thalassolituus sp. TaxID=2030822 RepID=UPI003981DBDA
MTEKDYIAQLFRVRRERFGISDDIYWGWFNPDDGSVEWKTWRHADADGMGGFANILRPLGFPCDPLPICNENKVPSWLEIFRASKENPRPAALKQINWKQTYAYSPDNMRMPEVAFLTREETIALKEKGKNQKLNYSNLAFSALNRVVAKKLVNGEDPYYWFIGVNIRGATNIRNEQFNQVSGINLPIYPDSDAAHWQQQMRLALKSKSHWATWKLANIGKYIGDGGLALVYRLSTNSSHFAGSCSVMGDWPLPDERNPEINNNRLLCAAGPGTANYPINSSLVGWNGATTLTLKLHPYICEDQTLIKILVNAWRDEILRDL